MNANLGFGQKLSVIRDDDPKVPLHDPVLDDISKQRGYESRTAVEKIVRRKEAEPSANLNIRPPITTYNRFVSWAMENRMSYPEALKELMDKAGV